ncbi:hypothetical protein WAI453_000039 [Rhynchosporium graminicola]
MRKVTFQLSYRTFVLHAPCHYDTTIPTSKLSRRDGQAGYSPTFGDRSRVEELLSSNTSLEKLGNATAQHVPARP